MSTAVFVLAVAIAHIALGGVSSALDTPPSTDAWTVWLVSGAVLGLLVACRRESRAAILVGAAPGAAVFNVLQGDLKPLNAIGYASIEVLAAPSGMVVFGWLSPLPTRLERPRDLAALVVAAPNTMHGRSARVSPATMRCASMSSWSTVSSAAKRPDRGC